MTKLQPCCAKNACMHAAACIVMQMPLNQMQPKGMGCYCSCHGTSLFHAVHAQKDGSVAKFHSDMCMANSLLHQDAGLVSQRRSPRPRPLLLLEQLPPMLLLLLLLQGPVKQAGKFVYLTLRA